MRIKYVCVTCFLLCAFSLKALSQGTPDNIQWLKTGHKYTQLIGTRASFSRIVLVDPETNFSEDIIASAADLTPPGQTSPLKVYSYTWYPELKKLLLFTDATRVWRARTRGNFWVYDAARKKLAQVGPQLPTLYSQFAKISTDGSKVAFVNKHNLFVQDLATTRVTQLTQNGSQRLINGTFDWVYEEELDCRDGFRWSPDSKSIAYWQVDARAIRNFLMINNTDSTYSYTIPVEYPKVGYDPSNVRIGVVTLQGTGRGKTNWLKIPGSPIQHFLPRLTWTTVPGELMIQQLNRKQDSSVLYLVNSKVEGGSIKKVYGEFDPAWIELSYHGQYDRPGWTWVDGGRSFLWQSEKDGWNHIYRISKDGKSSTLLTKGKYDVIDINGIDETNKLVYFTASPNNATQKYLYSTSLEGTGSATRVSHVNQTGTHEYQISPDGKYAVHTFSNHSTPPVSEFIALNSDGGQSKILRELVKAPSAQEAEKEIHNPTRFFQVTNSEGVTMDGQMTLPLHFDSTRRYPVLFNVYGEPAATLVNDTYNPNPFDQHLADTGYVIIAMDNRGTPSPKGREWRKSIYRSIGTLNTRDQALAARAVLAKYSFLDKSRVAVWGWSGGGSTTLNLMFRYPDLFQTGMSVAPVTNLQNYDNVYEERYMGLLSENPEDYHKGSAVNFVSGLKGHLLLVQGSGDDNVHYQNSEMLINELVRQGKPFQMMEYPNRSHGIYEGEGTREHLFALLEHFLLTNCPPGPR